MNNKRALIKATLLMLITNTSAYCGEKLLILDTGNSNSYTYRNAMLFVQSSGLTPEFKQWYQIDTNTITNYKKILLILDGSFLHAIAKQLKKSQTIESPLLKHIYTLIDTLSKQKNISIGIALPVPAKNPVAILALTEKILKRIGIIDKTTENRNIALILKSSLAHLLQSDARKSFGYDTGLLHKRKESTGPLSYFCPLKNEQTGEPLATLLPSITSYFSKPLKPLYPLGLSITNSTTNNRFLITNESYLTFADCPENFILNPVNPILKNRLLSAMQNMLYEFYTNSVGSKPINLQLPTVFTDAFIKNKKGIVKQQRKKTVHSSYQWIQKEGIACGWMGLEPFGNKQEAVAERILQSGLNVLWLQLRPEWYLSDNTTKNDKERSEFFDSIARFTSALAKKAKQLKVNAPHIFIGMEISGNFALKKVLNQAKDIYGKSYPHIPSPLDFNNYWKKEVLEVFERFYQQWQQSIGNGLPIAGIFLDLEMYHAPTEAAQYTDLMDFSDLAWEQYAKATKNQKLNTLKNHNDRISYLWQHKKFDEYFSIMASKAQTIGKKIKDNFHKILPNGIIAAYNISISNNWFYKGIMAGLSSQQDPLVLATFNNDFYSHYDWLVKNNTYLYHLPILLFSKLQTSNDFEKIDKLWQNHDGIWFNRYSRLEEPQEHNTPWNSSDVETTPLHTDVVIKLMKKHILKTRKRGE